MPHRKKQGTNLMGKAERINTAQRYLDGMHDPIRVVVSHSVAGVGEYICGINIIQHMRHSLSYYGVIEIIGSAQGSHDDYKRFYPSPLKEVMKLYGIEHLFKQDILKITFPDGLEVHFYDRNYFNQQKAQLPEVELAIFPGLFLAFKLEHGSYDRTGYYFENKLTNLAKAKRAIFFNPFTHVFTGGIFGFYLQLKDQIAEKYTEGLHLSYPVHLPSTERVMADVESIAEYHPLLSQTLKQLTTKRVLRNEITFAIYGVHHQPDPTPSLLNLILAAKKYVAESKGNKSLHIFLMSPVENSHWKKLQNLLSKKSILLPTLMRPKVLQILEKSQEKTDFIDVTLNQTALATESGTTQVYRLPPLPWSIFSALYDSDILPVYEGANAINLLSSASRWGLPCQAKNSIGDQLELPTLLQNVIPLVCVSAQKQLNFWSKKNPLDLLVSAMEQFSEQKRPERLLGNDRVATAIALVSQKETCFELRALDDPTRLNVCQLSEALQSPVYASQLPGNMMVKGLTYGILTGIAERVLECKGYESESSRPLAQFAQSLLQGIEICWPHHFFSFSDWKYNLLNEVDILVVFVLIAQLHLPNISFANKTMCVMLFVISLLPRLQNVDVNTMLFILPLALLYLVTLDVGRVTTKRVCSSIGFFPKPKPQPNASVYYLPEIQSDQE